MFIVIYGCMLMQTRRADPKQKTRIGELMTLVEYMTDVAKEMSLQSTAIRRDFSQHRLSAGENRQDLVEKFLVNHLPERFGVSTGFVISQDGMFSSQADLVVVDKLNNAPLYRHNRNMLWPSEAVYALIEVKTKLDSRDLRDAVLKGQRFKRLTRRFCQTRTAQNIEDSLFVIWSFESSLPQTMKANLVAALRDVPWDERPDFVISLDGIVARSGSFLEISKLGKPNSPYRRNLIASHGEDLSRLLPEPVEVYALGSNSLLAWYVWFDSWLRQAGSRFTNPADYLPNEYTFGTKNLILASGDLIGHHLGAVHLGQQCSDRSTAYPGDRDSPQPRRREHPVSLLNTAPP